MEKVLKALIVGMLDPQADYGAQRASLEEAGLLVETYGGSVDRVMTQNSSHRRSGTFLGMGKVEEIGAIVEAEEIGMVVINHHLKAGQLFTLKQLIAPEDECLIWDRTELILHIFQKHAHTAEAKLQIQLAELEYHGPELSGLGLTMSQQGGGIGTRGMGETNTEIMQRHYKNEVRAVKSKLEKVSQNRQQQMANRKSSRTPTVSIIGYTNAGKTSLFNALSSKQDTVQNALFATLDSSVGSLYLPNLGKQIFISDTIGFIQDLPPQLIEAFSSTLMETVGADVLLHVVDVSDPHLEMKLETVTKVLESLKVSATPQIYIFNKQDLLTQERLEELLRMYEKYCPLLVSAKLGEGLEAVIQMIEAKLLDLGYTRAAHLTYLDTLKQ
jgi:GTP-binding protein HflX